MKSTSLYIEGFDGAGISDGNGINFMVFRTYEGKLRVRNSETGAVFDAIPVPPHDDLIERNYLLDHVEMVSEDGLDDDYLPYSVIQCAPAIIKKNIGG